MIDRSRAVCEVTVQGNWDAEVARNGKGRQHLWHRSQVGAERCDWLANLPGSFDFWLSGQRVRLFHASNRGIYHRVHMTDPREAHLGMFENTDFTRFGPAPSVVGYGDVHDAFSMSLVGKTLFNPGSVGNPLDVPLASYAILEGAYGSEAAAQWSVSILRVPYDIEGAVRAGYASGMPDPDAYASELRTARYRKLPPLA